VSRCKSCERKAGQLARKCAKVIDASDKVIAGAQHICLDCQKILRVLVMLPTQDGEIKKP